MKDNRRGNTGWVIAAVAAACIAAACARPPPANINDACHMFQQRAEWHEAAQKSANRWRIPVEMIMAFMHQESSFNATARPPRRKLFGFIPWFRPSSAYGYSQATDATWKQYEKQTGRLFARRNSFPDSADFIGWYNDTSARTLGLPRDDAYSLYLAYHEGWTGYRNKTYNQKRWLLKVAEKVKKNAAVYRKQIKRCKLKPPGRRWYQWLPGF